MAIINQGKYTFKNTVSNVLNEYKEAILNPQICEETFEESIYWVYERLFKLSKPRVYYCNHPQELDSMEWRIGSRLNNGSHFDIALQQYIYHPAIDEIKRSSKQRRKSSVEYWSFFENEFPELKELNKFSGRINSCIDTHKRGGTSLKTRLNRVAALDVHLRMNSLVVEEFPYLKKLYLSGIGYLFFWEGFVFAIVGPIVRFDGQERLHSAVSPAIEWRNDPQEYYIHGREMPEWIFKLYGTETYYQRFLAERNEDVRAGIITMVKEREGNSGLLDFLKAALVDEKELPHFLGYKEILRLYKTKEKFNFLRDRHGNRGQPYCWSEFTCPSTGAIYLIDNSADFTDAVEAAKFLRPSFIPQELSYQWAHDAC